MATERIPLRVALAQVDATVGDVEGNAALIRQWIGRAREAGAQLVVFPELVVSGYPAEDLLLKPHFLDACAAALPSIAEESAGIVSVVGVPLHDDGIRNAAVVLADGENRGTYHKCLLPNYGVFDERRYFEPGPGPALIEVAGARVGLTICEDIWFPGPPASLEALAGASLIVNPSASPYHRGRGPFREGMVAERARETGAAYALCNTVGGQDELVFDGHSVVIAPDGETLARARQFQEDLVVCDLELPAASNGGGTGDAGLDRLPAASSPRVLVRLDVAHPGDSVNPQLPEPLDDCAEVYAALELGLRDYVTKNGFERVLVALSGGIDSALVALIASDALGPDRLTCVVMPSPHSSAETQADARAIASNLGAELVEMPISEAMRSYEALLSHEAPAPAGSAQAAETGTGGTSAAADLAAENIQARIRGNLIMAISNRTGWLVLTTGNKSEMSVGYATLYGDMAGGFAVIKDVPKTLVYELVRHRNAVADRELVPTSVLERAPSAELRPDQRDEDSLPPYEVLDRILEAYVEEDRSREEIVGDGLPDEVVDAVIAMVDRAEYKRRQAPPGIKITPKAFGRDRRLPITNRFRG
jgi:NAD+ synthase (glutamine-hydrolysing)